MDFESDISGYQMSQASLPGHLSPFISFIWMWVAWAGVAMGLVGFEVSQRRQDPPEWQCTPNRKIRAVQRKAVSPVRYTYQHRPLFGRELSPGAFFERMALCGISGRVKLYGLRYWAKRAARRARRFGNRVRQWRAPLGALGRLNGGFWGVHLRPG